MPSPELQVIKEIFSAAVELPRDRWKGFLDESCNGDARVRAEVEALLQEFAANGEDSFLERPAEAGAPRSKSTWSVIASSAMPRAAARAP